MAKIVLRPPVELCKTCKAIAAGTVPSGMISVEPAVKGWHTAVFFDDDERSRMGTVKCTLPKLYRQVAQVRGVQHAPA